MAAKKQTITRVRIAREELEKMTREDLQKCWNLQDQYVDLLETKLSSNSEHTELMSLRESEEKLKQQQLDASRRENILVMRLTTKEHEMQEFAGQIQELKQAQIPTIAQLRSALLDPAVNLLFERMRKEMDSLKARLEETQNELSAWKFTPDSNTGKRLMAKCRLLYQENEELGKMISSGKTAKLEGDLALQKSFSEEMKKSQSELDEFLLELDEDVEGMQSTIYYLQQQLREAKEQISQLQKDKTGSTDLSNSSPLSLSQLENTENGYKTPEPNFISNSDTMPDSLSNDINELSIESKVKTEPHSPYEKNLSDSEELNDGKASPGTNIPMQTVIVKNERTLESPVSILDKDFKSVIKNKEIINHDKNVPEEKINELNSAMDTSETALVITNDHNSEHNKGENLSNNSKLSESQNKATTNSSKKAPETGKGRKRTRPRTPVESEIIKDESSLPVRKRTRRREAERLQALEEKPLTVEINTDAEFQAAHTLASWASKQERTEPDTACSTLGNGELKKEDSDIK
nr:pre-mRNA-splicing regulator WTAP isoform X2 [Parasteatoda tepidariorum]XP_015911334.1 pre-mRNA-splicing regulator WTAP isoform X2 [Parasteatoda tepidariorum]